MKLVIKNLQNDTFTVDCEENNTVKELKEKIAAKDDLREKYDAELLKLLCTGKVMDDEELLSSFTIKPDGFLLLVKQTPGKPKPPPKKKPNQGFNNKYKGGFNSPYGMSQMPNSFMNHPFDQNSFMQQPFNQNSFMQQPFNPNTSSPQSFNQSTFPQQQQFSATETSALSDTAPESFTTAKDREEALQSMLAMGFDRAQSEQALRASFYNVETAIEYITSGNIPTVADTPAIPQGPGLGPSIGQGNQPSSSANRQQGGGGMGANLQQMRQILQQHPEQLQVLKQTIQAEHPEIAQMIEENPQAFLELLNQAGGDDQGPTGVSGAGGIGGAGGIEGAGGAGGQGQGTVKVSLSPQEQQIINRLQDMGFDRNRVLEAFLACDRNEELAVNYLLNAFD